MEDTTRGLPAQGAILEILTQGEFCVIISKIV